MLKVDGLREYWSKPRVAQDSIRRFVGAVVAHGLPAWRVRGIVVTDGVTYCDCENCNGHPGNEEHLNVDVIVSCPFERASCVAADRVLDAEGFCDSEIDRWGDGPFIEAAESFGNVEADIEMLRRSLGYS